MTDIVSPTAERPASSSSFRDFLRRLNFSTWLGIVIVLGLIIAAVFAPVFATHDPNAQNIILYLSPPGGENILGPDQFGRDIPACSMARAIL